MDEANRSLIGQATLTRRGFLRVATLLAGGAAIGTLSACSAQPAAPAKPAEAPKPAEAAKPAAPAAAPAKPAEAAKPAAPAAAAQQAPSSAKPGDFDWKKYKGTTINLALNKHPYTESLMPLLDQFKEETGMDAQFLILPEAEYFRKIELDMSTGAGEYDVFMCGPTRNWTYAKPGWLEPLDQYLGDAKLTHPEYDHADFFPLLREANMWDKTVGGGVGKGSTWAIPVHVETYVLAYRKDIFDEKGIKVPTNLDEWSDAAKKATFKDKDGSQIYGTIQRGVRDGNTGTGFVSAYRAYGNVDFDDNFNVQVNQPGAVKFYEQWAQTVKETSTPGWTNVTWYEGKESFTQGKYAMYFDCDFFGAGYEDKSTSKVAGKVGYAPPLSPSPDKRWSNLYTWALGMSAASKHKEAAWYLIQWATSRQRLLDATTKYNNYNPTRKSVFDNPQVQETMKSWGSGTYLPTVLDNLTKYAKIAYRPNPELPAFNVRTSQALQEVWNGQPAQKVMDAAAEEINANMTKAGWRKASHSAERVVRFPWPPGGARGSLPVLPGFKAASLAS